MIAPAEAPARATSGSPSSILRRLGSALTISGAAAAVAAIPAAIRTSGASVFASLLLLTGATLLPMTATVLLLRGARGGLRSFDNPYAREHLAGLAAWASLAMMAFAALGAVLRATTHHHALAGVTFAILALGTTVGAALVVRRATIALTLASAQTRRVAVGAFWIALSIALLLLAVAASRGAVQDRASGTGALVVDLLAFALAAGFASRPFDSREARVSRFAPLAFLLLPVAVVLARLLPDLSPVVANDAPLYAALIGASPGPSADVVPSAPSEPPASAGP